MRMFLVTVVFKRDMVVKWSSLVKEENHFFFFKYTCTLSKRARTSEKNSPSFQNVRILMFNSYLNVCENSNEKQRIVKRFA